MKQNARDQKRRSAHTITPAWGNPQVAFIIMKERQTPTNLASLSSMGCRGGGIGRHVHSPYSLLARWACRGSGWVLWFVGKWLTSTMLSGTMRVVSWHHHLWGVFYTLIV